MKDASCFTISLVVATIVAQFCVFNGKRWLESNVESEYNNSIKGTDHQVELLLQNNTIVCTNNSSRKGSDSEECCMTWEVDADEWWLHKPDWEICKENKNGFCFAPIENKEKAKFLQTIHEFQWITGNCSNVEKSVEMNSGFGAGINWLAYSFWHAHKLNKPFQIVYGNRRWLYSTANKTSWAYCNTEDTRCYWLPISNCSRTETIRGEHADARPNGSIDEKLRFYWLRGYMLRPRQHFRKKLFEMRQKVDMKYPCTTMHVRRGDAGLPRPPFRRYAAVQEYIDAANIKEGDNVFLMTDDESTIEEVNRHLPNYNWIYLDRPRNYGVKGGFNGHIASGDEGQDLLALRLASTCEKVVHGHSGFMKAFIDTLHLEGRNCTVHYVDTTVSKSEAQKYGGDYQARLKSFWKSIENVYSEKQNKTRVGEMKLFERPLHLRYL